ncbi:MAG: ABC transporter transmembrane domain-containing protein [Promethearchaeota archaeon]
MEKTKRYVDDKTLWKWMFSYLKDKKVLFIGLLAAMFLFTGMQAVLPLLQQILIDDGIIGSNQAIVISILVVYASFRILSSIGNGIIEFTMAKIGTNVVYRVRQDLFSKIQQTSMDFFDKSRSGDIISTVTNDVDQLNQVFGGQLATLLTDLFRGLLVLVLMFVMNWELTIVALLMIPLLLLLSRTFTKNVRNMFKKTRKELSNVTSVAEQNISGMKVIQAYGKQKEAADEFNVANRRNQASFLKVRRIMSFLFPLFIFIMSLMSALVMLYSGSALLNGKGFFGSTITIGMVSSFSNYLNQLLMPVMMLAFFGQQMQSTLAAAERVYALLNEENEIPDPETPEDFTTTRGEIAFDSVTFAYQARQVKVPVKIIDPDAKKQKWWKKGKKSKMSKESKDPHGQEKGAEKEGPPIMAEANHKYNQAMAKLLSDPEAYLKLARNLDKQIKGTGKGAKLGSGGGDSGSMGGGGDNSNMGGGGMGGPGGKRDLSKLPRNQILEILGSPRVPPEIYEQFSGTVKALIEEDRLIREHESHTGNVLENMSLTIDSGKTVAIVGPTGAGKSTLIKLISRFYDIGDDNGSISIDQINIKDLRKKDLRKVIGMVPQDSFLFNGTILENLYYGLPSNTPREMNEKVLEITKFLGLHNFIEHMPEKYDTVLIENASNLSVGQRQLIAFARVLMLDPSILILDEATSSVDPYTETLIQDALEKVKTGRTTIIIAHRLSTIKNADEIFVIDHGKLIERGTHDHLLTLNGHYARLVEMQAMDV